MADCRAPVISDLDETLRSLTPQGVTKILKAEYTPTKNGKAAFLSDVWAGRATHYAGPGDLPSSKAESDKRVAWLRRLVRYDQSAAGNDVYSGLYPTPRHVTQLPRLCVFLGVHASHAFLMGSSSTSSLSSSSSSSSSSFEARYLDPKIKGLINSAGRMITRRSAQVQTWAKTFVYESRYQQVATFLEWLNRPEHTELSCGEALDGFYASHGPRWPDTKRVAHAYRPAPPSIMTSSNFAVLLRQNIALRQDAATADEAVPAAAAEVDAAAAAPAVSDDNGHLDILDGTIGLADDQDASFVHELASLLALQGRAAIAAVMKCPQIVDAITKSRRVGSEQSTLRDVCDALCTRVGANAGMTEDAFQNDVHAPLQVLLRELDMKALRGFKTYLARNHTVYKNSIDNLRDMYHGLRGGVGATVKSLKAAMQARINLGIKHKEAQCALRGHQPDHSAVLLCIAWDGWTRGHSADATSPGHAKRTQIVVSLGGDGSIGTTGRGCTTVGAWTGDDGREHVMHQLHIHRSDIRGILDESITFEHPNRSGQQITAHMICALDGLTARSSKGMMDAGSQNPNDNNLVALSLYKSNYSDGAFHVAMPSQLKAIAEAWKSHLGDHGNLCNGAPDVLAKMTMTIQAWNYTLKMPAIPLELMPHCFQAPFHLVTTPTKTLFKMLFSGAHSLGTGAQVAEAVRNKGYGTLNYDMATATADGIINLSAGLSGGQYIEAIANCFAGIAEALVPNSTSWEGEALKMDRRERLVAHLASALKLFAINSVRVLLARPGEFKTYTKFATAYAANEHCLQAKLAAIFGPRWLTPTFKNRWYTIQLFIERFLREFALNLPDAANEEKLEERHKYLNKLIATLHMRGADNKAEEYKSLIAHSDLSDHMAFERAGGYEQYSEKNAARHDRLLANRRRQATGTGGMPQEFQKSEAERLNRWRTRRAATVSSESLSSSSLSSSNGISRSSYFLTESCCEPAQPPPPEEEGESEDEEDEVEDEDDDKDSDEEEEENDDGCAEGGDVDTEFIELASSLGMNVVATHKSTKFTAVATVYGNTMGTSQVVVPRFGANNQDIKVFITGKKYMRIECIAIRKICIQLRRGQDPGRAKKKRKKQQSSSSFCCQYCDLQGDGVEQLHCGHGLDCKLWSPNCFVSGGGAASLSSSSSSPSSSSSSSSSSSGKRKREAGCDVADWSTFAICIDLLVPPEVYELKKVKTNYKSGKKQGQRRTVEKPFLVEGGMGTKSTRVLIFAGKAGRRPTTCEKIRSDFFHIGDMQFKGTYKFSIPVEETDGTEQWPRAEEAGNPGEDEYKKRKKAAKDASVLAKAPLVLACDDATGERMDSLLKELDLIDDDFWGWATEGKHLLGGDDCRRCLCPFCGVRVVIPAYRADGKYPGSMCIPVWTELKDSGGLGQPHLECSSLVKASWVEKMGGSKGSRGED